jgi:dienelactone hydrolase
MAGLWSGLAFAQPSGSVSPSQPLSSTSASDYQSLSARAWLFRPEAQPPKALVVLLHGCGGLFTKSDVLQARFKDYVPALLDRGHAVLLVDSFGLRGQREICTQRYNERQITAADRANDVRDVLGWAKGLDQIKNLPVVLIGWSNGATSLLEVLHQAAVNSAWAESRVRIDRVVAFYPGCNASLKRDLVPPVPVLLMTGQLDDWTPEAPCRQWAERHSSVVEHRSFEGAHHGFDGTSRLRKRFDVPNGSNPGQGVWVGGHPKAREEAHRALWRFLEGIHSVS